MVVKQRKYKSVSISSPSKLLFLIYIYVSSIGKGIKDLTSLEHLQMDFRWLIDFCSSVHIYIYISLYLSLIHI